MSRSAFTASRDARIEAEDVLQALIVADSFDLKFMPLTKDRPRCLLPLCNVPLIEYTLEFLASSSVKEVFIACCAHHQMIKNYISKSRWGIQNSALKVKVLFIRSALSLGDVMREIDTLAIIKSDFVLVNGDVVGNIRLDSVVDAHRKRKLTDPNCILTMAVMKGSAFHRARATHDIFVLDPETSQCQQYIPMPLVHLTDASVSVIPEVLKICSDVDLHNDLIDCEVDICTLDVLALFSENFDYQVMRSDFVRGILESEVIEKTIYAHFTAPDEYAVRVRNTQLYDCVSMDVVCRWTYPLVPESNFFGDTTLRRSRGNVYREPGVLFTRDVPPDGGILARHAQMNAAAAAALDSLSTSMNSTISNQPADTEDSANERHAQPPPVHPARAPLAKESVFAPTKVAESDAALYTTQQVFSRSFKPTNVVIGRGTTLAPRVKLQSTVIGRECHIGHDSRLTHSYLWENVTVGDRCRISSAILSNDVVLGRGAVIEPGCLLGPGVRIGARVRVPAFSRIYYDGQNTDSALVGEDGLGTLWVPSDNNDNEDDSNDDDHDEYSSGSEYAAHSGYSHDNERSRRRSRHDPSVQISILMESIGCNPEMLGAHLADRLAADLEGEDLYACTLAESEEYDSVGDGAMYTGGNGGGGGGGGGDGGGAGGNGLYGRDEIGAGAGGRGGAGARNGSKGGRISMLARNSIVGISEDMLFETQSERVAERQHAADEVRATIQRSLDENHDMSNAILELNTLKFALNLSFRDLRVTVVPCILNHVFSNPLVNIGSHANANSNALTGVAAVKAFENYMPILSAQVHSVLDRSDFLKILVGWFVGCAVVESAQKCTAAETAAAAAAAAAAATAAAASGTGNRLALERLIVVPDSTICVVAGGNSLWFLDTRLATPMGFVNAHAAAITALGICPDQRLVVAGDRAGVLRIWNPATRSLVADYSTVAQDSLRSMLYINDSQLLTGGKSGIMRLYDVPAASAQ